MSPTFALAAVASLLFATVSVHAESHTVTFVNQCGKGTPTLIVGGQVVSTGQPYTSNGPLDSAIAYASFFFLSGDCGYNGEQCTLLEMTLGNPTVPGGGSSTDISLISPHTFNVEASFSYYDGCDNTGADCAYQGCPMAFYQSNDNQVQVACQTDNVGAPRHSSSCARSDVPSPGQLADRILCGC
ncbi:hypothetical protein BKA93DRAFT_721921 [Sparassis latifolia]